MQRLVLVMAMVALFGCAKGEDSALYKVQVQGAQVAVGGQGTATVRFEGKRGYHWNPDFPARLRFGETSGIAMDKSEFKQGAGDFKDDGGVGVVEIPVRATAPGQMALKGVADFGVCDEKTCQVFRGVQVEVPINAR